jgi:hypothetical protein
VGNVRAEEGVWVDAVLKDLLFNNAKPQFLWVLGVV